MADMLAVITVEALSLGLEPAESDETLLPELPWNIILHIMELMPSGARAWSARRTCKAMHEKFKDQFIIPLDSPELPPTAVKEALRCATTQAQQWQLMAARAECGDLQGLQWLHSQGCMWDCRVCSAAAAGGFLDILKWARTQKDPCPWNSSVCSAAAANGHLQVLQWARSQMPPCPWNSDVCRYPYALPRHFPSAIHLQSAGDFGSRDLREVARRLRYAAGQGHLHVLQWARAQEPPCPWTAWVCSDAAAKGQPFILKWLREQDPPCPWNKRECEQLAMRGKGLISLLRLLPE